MTTFTLYTHTHDGQTAVGYLDLAGTGMIDVEMPAGFAAGTDNEGQPALIETATREIGSLVWEQGYQQPAIVTASGAYPLRIVRQSDPVTGRF